MMTGERTGNTPIEAMIFDYIQLMGHMADIDTTVITDITLYYRDTLGMAIPHNYPFCGSGFNVTMAGIHVDGVSKDEEIYNIFDTAKLLKRPLGVTITDKSGVAGVAFWMNEYLHLRGDQRIDKRHPGVQAMYADLMVQYNAGRTSGMSPDEMLALAKKHLPEHFR